VSATASATAVASPAGRQVELARSYGTDAGEVDVRVNRTEYGAQRHQHYENYSPDEHPKSS